MGETRTSTTIGDGGLGAIEVLPGALAARPTIRWLCLSFAWRQRPMVKDNLGAITGSIESRLELHR
jgi:hypothetical protein